MQKRCRSRRLECDWDLNREPDLMKQLNTLFWLRRIPRALLHECINPSTSYNSILQSYYTCLTDSL